MSIYANSMQKMLFSDRKVNRIVYSEIMLRCFIALLDEDEDHELESSADYEEILQALFVIRKIHEWSIYACNFDVDCMNFEIERVCELKGIRYEQEK